MYRRLALVAGAALLLITATQADARQVRTKEASVQKTHTHKSVRKSRQARKAREIGRRYAVIYRELASARRELKALRNEIEAPRRPGVMMAMAAKLPVVIPEKPKWREVAVTTVLMASLPMELPKLPLAPPIKAVVEPAKVWLTRFAAYPAALVNKAWQLHQECGGWVSSAYRAKNKRSQHSKWKAFDIHGDYACMYRLLAGWPGGINVDAWRVNHIHLDVRATACRFWHRGHGPRGCNYALPSQPTYARGGRHKRHKRADLGWQSPLV